MARKIFKLFNIYCLFFLSALLFTFFGCGKDATDKSIDTQNSTKTEDITPPYTIQKIKPQKITNEIHVVGSVTAYQEVDVSPEISGKIIKIYFNTGDNASQDDLLAEIDDESRVISLKKKKALLKKAEATIKKAYKDASKGGTLFKEGVISDTESDGIMLDRQIADADLNLARAEVMAAEKELRDIKITAPFAGKIALKNVEIGMLVTPGQSLFTLVDIKKVKIIVNISELDITKVSAGDKAEVLLDSLSGKSFSGIIETIGLKADDSSRTFPLEIVVVNEGESLLPGMVARVTIKSKYPDTVIIVPRKAVRTVNGMKVAYVMNNNKIEQRKLYIKSEMDDCFVIEKGLHEGDNLIVSEVKQECN